MNLLNPNTDRTHRCVDCGCIWEAWNPDFCPECDSVNFFCANIPVKMQTISEDGMPENQIVSLVMQSEASRAEGAKCRIKLQIDGKDTGLSFELNHSANLALHWALEEAQHDWNRKTKTQDGPTLLENNLSNLDMEKMSGGICTDLIANEYYRIGQEILGTTDTTFGAPNPVEEKV
jgi:hypothetical protein